MLQSPFQKKLLIISLGALTVVVLGCRPRSSENNSGVLATGPIGAPSATFTHMCSHFNQLNADQRDAFGMFLGEAYEETENDALGSSSFSASPIDVLAQNTCAEIWARFNEKPVFSVVAGTKDLAVLDSLTGIQNLDLSYSVKQFGKNFKIIETLNVVTLRVFANSVGGFSMTAADRDQVLKTASASANLTTLELSDLGITNLTALAGLKKIRKLTIKGNGIDDLSFLANWQEIRDLEAYQNNISDLKPLKDLLQLEMLGISENQIQNIEPLMLLGNLKKIEMNDNPTISNIFALQFLPALADLQINNSGISDLEPLRNLPLRQLAIENTPVTTLEPLRNTPIERLFVRGTKISDLKPIVDMKKLITLNVANTAVHELPVLTAPHALQTLSVEGTQVTNHCPAYHYPSIKNLMRSNQTMWQKFQGIPANCH